MIWVVGVAVLLILLLILPVGADLRYREEDFTLFLKIGFLVFPLESEEEPEKPVEVQQPWEDQPAHWWKLPTPRDILNWSLSGFRALRDLIKSYEDEGFYIKDVRDLFGLLPVARKAVVRVVRHLSVDWVQVHYVVASEDPYDAVMQYGVINAAYSALSPLLHRVFNIRDEEIGLDVDVMAEESYVRARVVATLQIWQILYIAACAGAGFLKWYLPFRKKLKAQAKQRVPKAAPEEQKG